MKKIYFLYFVISFVLMNLLNHAQAQVCRDFYFPDFVSQKERETINLLYLKNATEPEFCELRKKTHEIEDILENIRRALMLDRCSLPKSKMYDFDAYYFEPVLYKAMLNAVDFYFDPKIKIKYEYEKDGEKISKNLFNFDDPSEWKYRFREELSYIETISNENLEKLKIIMKKEDIQSAIKNFIFMNYISYKFNYINYFNKKIVINRIIFLKEYLVKTNKLNWFLKSLKEIDEKIAQDFSEIKSHDEYQKEIDLQLQRKYPNEIKILEDYKIGDYDKLENLGKFFQKYNNETDEKSDSILYNKLFDNLSKKDREIINEFEKNKIIKNFHLFKEFNYFENKITENYLEIYGNFIHQIFFYELLNLNFTSSLDISSKNFITIRKKMLEKYQKPAHFFVKDNSYLPYVNNKILINNQHKPICDYLSEHREEIKNKN